MSLTRDDIKRIYNDPDYWNIKPYDGTAYSDVYAGIVDLVGQHIGLPLESRWNDFFRCRYLGKTVVEIGCARGWLLKDVQERGGDVMGVDVSDYIVAKSPIKERIHVGFIEDGTPFADNSFDIGFSVENMEHLLDLDAGLMEIKRIMKPDSFFYISAGMDDDEGRHVNIMDRAEWAARLNVSGFMVLRDKTEAFRKHRLCREYGWNSFITKISK